MKQYLKLVYLGVFLALVSSISTGIMGYVASATRKARENAVEAKMTEGLRLVLPPFDNDLLATAKSCEENGGTKAQLYVARKSGKIVGVAVKTSTMQGYGGKIEGIVSFSPEGKVCSFIITSHQETPGLGAPLTERKDAKTLKGLITGKKKERKPFPLHLPANKLLDQFSGKKAQKRLWKLKSEGGEIDGISGATITSLAITDLASRASAVFVKNQKAIFGTSMKGSGK